MPIISVIVPVYNVEPYLSRCIDSILAQTFTDFELILVDDGSPDNCGKICDEYAEKDSRIVVIHKENGGLSSARNAGIDRAFKNISCEFLAFVDSDDFITEKYLEKLFEATDDGVDITSCDMLCFTDHDELLSEMKALKTEDTKETYSGAEAVKHLYKMDGSISIEAWCKLYRKGLFSTIRFPEGKIHEDQAIVPILIYNARKVVCMGDALYCYFKRSNSITRELFSLRRFDDIEALSNCETFFLNNGEYDIAYLVNKRKIVLWSLYTLYARKAGIYKELPSDYKMPKIKALHNLEKRMSFDRFTWRLSQLYPFWVKPYTYWVKLLKMLRLYNNISD